DYAKRYLIKKYGGASVFGGGYRVTTSLDLTMQQEAVDAVNAHLSAGDPEAALVAIDPKNGQILAMVGGRSFQKSQVNLATGQGGSGRQAGSSFKPFTLATAMEQKFSLTTQYWNGPSQITIPDKECYSSSGPWQPANASDS